ncbi:hypothetical protein TorRG33x02_137540 [Trema orientale]|uniref:Transmembrane protein n=1 Tax=Trema orientale TaxID=63057 RepID=A0A2P5EY58_TREOI|nr:hypothetical protein TorRG33x02_137540 [Trema orientale]
MIKTTYLPLLKALRAIRVGFLNGDGDSDADPRWRIGLFVDPAFENSSEAAFSQHRVGSKVPGGPLELRQGEQFQARSYNFPIWNWRTTRTSTRTSTSTSTSATTTIIVCFVIGLVVLIICTPNYLGLNRVSPFATTSILCVVVVLSIVLVVIVFRCFCETIVDITQKGEIEIKLDIQVYVWLMRK